MFSFIIGCLLIFITGDFLREGYLVFRGKTTDRRGKPLRVYGILNEKMPIAKNKAQALLFTFMVAIVTGALGVTMTGSFLKQLFRNGTH